MNKEGVNNKPLTLDDLAQYNEEVLLPAIDKRFEKGMTEMKNKVLTALDENTELLHTIRQEQIATSSAIDKKLTPGVSWQYNFIIVY